MRAMLAFAVSTFALSGCASTTGLNVSMVSSPQPTEGDPEGPRRGEVRYYKSLSDSRTQEIRDLALKNATDACGGPYEIEDETNKRNWRHIHFKCVGTAEEGTAEERTAEEGTAEEGTAEESTAPNAADAGPE